MTYANSLDSDQDQQTVWTQISLDSDQDLQHVDQDLQHSDGVPERIL